MVESVKINGKDYAYPTKLTVTEWAQGRLLQRRVDEAISAVSLGESEEAIAKAQEAIDTSWSGFVRIAFGEAAVAELAIDKVDLRDMLEATTGFTKAALRVPGTPATAQ